MHSLKRGPTGDIRSHVHAYIPNGQDKYSQDRISNSHISSYFEILMLPWDSEAKTSGRETKISPG